MTVMVFYIDSQGHRRGWAKSDHVEEARSQAKERLEGWIERTNEALGEAEWTVDDFEEFVADVRETS
ncbi:MAG: hypothetical protein CMJ85_13200 [Planctomycetes bacterium]|jgi:hypothetical protein|nr:hypothetical protein [Planctomycetota bacterium]MDP6424907.1 hypothetical protein [Planctomycetota bacterium]